MGELASRFGVEPPVRVARARRPAAAVPTTAALVEAAAARAGAQEAQWERLRPRGRPAGAPFVRLSARPTTNAVGLNGSAWRQAFGQRDHVPVKLHLLRAARRLAVTEASDGDRDYLAASSHGCGHLGSNGLADTLAAAGFAPGRYRARCSPGRIEIAAADRLP
ncbi:MAG: hypothetical protein KGK07_15625 [Chloroflexota bacterium]|nr:hypothetical protein [Chloroflexota bacterium]